jgi:hypothetical protein
VLVYSAHAKRDLFNEQDAIGCAVRVSSIGL